MRYFYAVMLISAGLVFLLGFREQFEHGLAVFTGNIDVSASGQISKPNPAVHTLSYAIPIAAISIGCLTLLRARLNQRQRSSQHSTHHHV